MVTQQDTDLIGAVVGKILAGAPPLVIYLYSKPDGYSHVRCDELPQFHTQHQAIGALARSFRPAVVDVWRNRFYPCWYFLQLKREWGPNTLHAFGLPWSVYWGWRKHLCQE